MRVANALVNSFVLTLACVVPAAAQVQQGGSVTRGHVTTWGAPGVVMDGGTATAGQINSLGLYGNGGTPFCISSSATPAPYSGSYWLQCEGVSSTAGGGISLSGPSALPWSLTINGTPVLTATQAGVSIPSLAFSNAGATPVTANGITNPLGTWMGYLAGVANPNSLLEAPGAKITVQGTGTFQVGGLLGPYILNDGAADTVSIQSQAGALPSGGATQLQLYPSVIGKPTWFIVTPFNGSGGADAEELLIGSTGHPGNYQFTQVVLGKGTCHQVDFLDGLSATPAWSLGCGGYMVLPNNVGIWSRNAANTADENLLLLDATNTLDLGYGVGGVAIPVHVNGALSVTGNASVGGTLTITVASPSFSNSTYNTYGSFLLNGAAPGSWFASQQGGNNATDGMTGAVDIPSGAANHQVNGVAGYVVSRRSRPVGNGGDVGGYFQAGCAATGCNVFGFNSLAYDSPSFTGQALQNELDFNAGQPSTTVAGLGIVLNSSVALTNTPLGYTCRIAGTTPWNKCVYTPDGASVYGAYFGAASTGNGTNSQQIALASRSSGGVNYLATILADSNGGLDLRPGVAGAAVGFQTYGGSTVAYVDGSGVFNGTGLAVTGNASVGGALITTTGTPASSSAPCTQGQIEFDAAYVYTCVATNTWRRAASSAF